MGRPEPAVHRPHRRRPCRRAAHRGSRGHLVSLLGGGGVRSGRPSQGGRRRGTLAPRRVRRRRPDDIFGGPLRGRPDRHRAHPQRRGLLLAQYRLRPLRRQGHDGRRAPVRCARPVRPAPHPPGRHRRLGSDRHRLSRPRPDPLLVQPRGKRLGPGRRSARFPTGGQHRLGRRRRPHGQRHRLPGLVLAVAGSGPGADEIPRAHGQRKTPSAGRRPQQPGGRNAGELRAVDLFLSAGQVRRPAVDHQPAVPGSRGRAGGNRRPHRPKPIRHPLRLSPRLFRRI